MASATGFSGVVQVSLGARILVRKAWGLADRAHDIANTVDTQFGIASGTKGFTALAVMALVADGSLALDVSVRRVIGDDIDLIDPSVTVYQLLAHTSGIGDYLDESIHQDADEYVMPVPVHQLAETKDFVSILRGFPMKAGPGERFEYCNGGFVVLALVVEATSGASFHEVVAQRVLDPAGMTDTAFLRTDQLPGSAALGYIEDENGWRTNHLHLPVRGNGDGGAYSTLEDFSKFWPALFAGRIVPQSLVAEMVRAHNDVPAESMRYGLGFWLRADRDTVMLEGYDAGVSFRSAFDPQSELQYTVISNTGSGAWPLVKLLDEMLPELAALDN
jgi:CubicO group peptidase (beta-lactamase class C family)